MGQQDKVFMRTFVTILAFLVGLAFVFYGAAQMVSSSGQKTLATAQGDMNTSKEGQVHSAAKVSPRSGSPAQYGATCLSCHKSGVAGAPKVGNKGDWAPRAKKGMKGMVEVVVKGKGAMPPKGGTNLSKAQIEAVIKLLMEGTDIII